MSFKASNWARVQRLHRTPKTVLVYLAERANEKQGYCCFPGQKLIAAETGLSERTVRMALKYLDEMGFIDRAPQRRKDGYRTSDTIEVLISDDEPNSFTPYGEWYRQQGSHRQVEHSHRQLLPISPAAPAGPIENQKAEPEGEQEDSLTSTDSSTTSSDARENARMMQVLVETTLIQAQSVAEFSDEDVLSQWELILNTAQLPFQDHPGMSAANLLLIAAVETEVSKRFGGVS